jgi:hypothetical protein
MVGTDGFNVVVMIPPYPLKLGPGPELILAVLLYCSAPIET